MSDNETVIDQRGDLIESKMNMDRASSIGVSFGGLNIEDMAQVIELAKGMSLSRSMVPAFLRNNVWGCFGICVQAKEWNMSPFSLARMAYEVENYRTKERTVAYMSQVYHAVLESRAVLKERLEVRFEGEGDDMVCIVSGTFRNEAKAREWSSPPLGERKPKPRKGTNRNTGEDYETTPGSPLWQAKPLVQLFYDTSRDWARVYCPDITLGIYSTDEMSDAGFTSVGGAALPAPDDGGLAQRLSASSLARTGFPAAQVAEEVDGAVAGRDAPSPTVDPLASDAPPAAAESEGGDETVGTLKGRPRASRSRRAGPPHGRTS